MTTLTLTLADDVKALAEARATEAGFATVDAYLANLIESDVGVPLDAALEADLLVGLKCGAREITDQDWRQKQQALRRKVQQRRQAMIRLVVSSEADRDIDCIADQIAADNFDAAIRFYSAVRETCTLLIDHPRIGTRRVAKNPNLTGTRSLVVNGFRNFLIFFIPSDDEVRVLRVFHGARDLGRWLNR